MVVSPVSVSIHAPRAGRDSLSDFSSPICRSFNPRAPCGARRPRLRAACPALYVSIHAPRAGRDILRHHMLSVAAHVSIHAPRAGRDSRTTTASAATRTFQSTRPVRGATRIKKPHRHNFRRFNPRAPCGARPLPLGLVAASTRFQSTRPVRGATPHRVALEPHRPVSIHAPRAGRDRSPACTSFSSALFQSTRPVRGATGGHGLSHRPGGVSIHAPRAGRDCRISNSVHDCTPFQSTRPVRGATSAWPSRPRAQRVSIHAPRAGRDDASRPTRRCARRFNPRAPCGARLSTGHCSPSPPKFQSTRPVRGATPPPPKLQPRRGVSIHAPRAGRDERVQHDATASAGFNPRAPCGARRCSSYGNRIATGFQSTRPVRGATGVLGRGEMG